MPTITLENGKKVEISQESYDALAKAIKERRWKPMHNHEYWCVDGAVDVIKSCWTGFRTDNWRYSQRNVFKTEEEAEKHLEYLKALAMLKDDAEDFEPEWNNTGQSKWEINYDHADRELFARDIIRVQSVGNIYFETQEQALHSIDTHEKEWLTVLKVEK